ncbi:AraC family transcriptional regulator [Paenibacillus sp. 7124]|uniref:AraC family transcriptional regulator n=1 Tax=Paenibacillus apii TaxID=1850370 RepID=A0A6M1PH90_9BACL|nr:AraC family transcriptional regulator [Paenibacillus apii]NGM82877.1 AraC family transcriptional regulator [Paenibacillus apii]NJJ40017.1 AraC family transcriptional regulator [Paenibacillus apii]
MKLYLEIPELDKHFPFRSFVTKGDRLCYPHWHKEIEIIYVAKGSVDLGINDVPIHLSQGEIQFVDSGDVHYFLASPDSERVVIQFDLGFFQEVPVMDVREHSLRDIFASMEHSGRKWPAGVADKMRRLIESIHEENTRRADGYAYLIKARMFEMLTLIFREVPKSGAHRQPKISEESATKSRETLEKLERIFTYVENHYREAISLKEVAQYMGFSPYYFTKLFKRNTGMTFVSFLNEYRLNKAKWMLLNGDAPMTEVAEASGFGSVKTFHHFFKEATGISPLKYRRTIYGNNSARM